MKTTLEGCRVDIVAMLDELARATDVGVWIWQAGRNAVWDWELPWARAQEDKDTLGIRG